MGKSSLEVNVAETKQEFPPTKMVNNVIRSVKGVFPPKNQ